MSISWERRVVVTGIGAVTPIGMGVTGLRRGLRAGRSAVRTIASFDTSALNSHVAAPVCEAIPDDWVCGGTSDPLDRYSLFAVAAARMAVADGGIDLEREDREQIGISIGTALGGVAFAEQQYPRYAAHGAAGVSPHLALSVFNGAGPCRVAEDLKLYGPVTANGDSCAASPIAIGRAVDLIRGGTADVMLAGGSEAPLAPLTFSAFSIIRAMSERNADPCTASRPFDAGRDGFVMAEGSAMLLLEEYGHARDRGARIYGEILGHACTNDAFHMTQPRLDRVQTVRCMQNCLRDGGMRTEQVGYINAHGSSTTLNDSSETAAIKEVFGDRAYAMPVSGTKGFHGHALGATGAWEAAICLLALQDDWLPPTLNLITPDPACDLDYIREPGGRSARVDCILSNSFGFGGINACLLFGRV